MFKELEDVIERLVGISTTRNAVSAKVDAYHVIEAPAAPPPVKAPPPPPPAPKIFNLGTAENVLLYDELRPLLTDFSGLTLDDTQYAFLDYKAPGKGKGGGTAAALNRQAATFLNRAYGLGDDELLTEGNVIATAGTCAALEALGFAICNPGDPVIAPAPCWQGFGYFFTFRPGAVFVPFSVSKTADNEFNLTLDDVKAAYNIVATSGGPPPKVLVLTNPQNPLGINYSADLLQEIFQWAMAQPGLHIIVDEIYFNSQTDPNAKFTPAFKVPAYKDGNNAERIHVVWGLSKDFGLAGYRVAFVATRSPAVLNVLVNKWEYFLSPASALANYTVINKLFVGNCDSALKLMQTYRERLAKQRKAVAAALDADGIKYYKDDGAAQFFWLDLRGYLDKVKPDKPLPTVPYDTYEFERSLYDKMYNLDSSGAPKAPSVHLEAGHELFAPEPGWFRLCYTCLPEAQMLDGVKTMIEILKSLSSSSS